MESDSIFLKNNISSVPNENIRCSPADNLPTGISGEALQISYRKETAETENTKQKVGSRGHDTTDTSFLVGNIGVDNEKKIESKSDISAQKTT